MYEPPFPRLVIRPGAVTQLRFLGLIMPTEDYGQLAAHLDATDHKSTKVHSEPFSQLAGDSCQATCTNSLPIDNRHASGLEGALRILLPVAASLRDLDARWSLNNSVTDPPDPNQPGQLQPFPFIARWPVDATEMVDVIKRHCPATTHPLESPLADQTFDKFVVSGGSDAHACRDNPRSSPRFEVPCGGSANPDRLLSDSALNTLRSLIGTADLPLAYRNEATRWSCVRSCPCAKSAAAEGHLLQCRRDECMECEHDKQSGLSFCACHMALRRGCLWPNCHRAEHATMRVIYEGRVGVADPTARTTLGGMRMLYRPGNRTGQYT